jgi:hypothetical protein
MSAVPCPGCEGDAAPKLWHESAALHTASIQNLCPLCGVCMQSSGGEPNALAVVARRTGTGFAYALNLVLVFAIIAVSVNSLAIALDLEEATARALATLVTVSAFACRKKLIRTLPVSVRAMIVG